MIFDFIYDVNWAAVSVSLLVAFVLGLGWFTPAVFGSYWARQVARYTNISEADITSSAALPVPLVRWIVGISVNVVVLALVIEALDADSALDGAVLGITLSLGFGATISAWPPIFARMPWEWWLVNNGAFLLMQISAGSVLAIWR